MTSTGIPHAVFAKKGWTVPQPSVQIFSSKEELVATVLEVAKKYFSNPSCVEIEDYACAASLKHQPLEDQNDVHSTVLMQADKWSAMKKLEKKYGSWPYCHISARVILTFLSTDNLAKRNTNTFREHLLPTSQIVMLTCIARSKRVNKNNAGSK